MPKSHAAILIIPTLVALASCVELRDSLAESTARAEEAAPTALRVKEDLARGRRWELGWGVASAYDIASGELVRRIRLEGASLSNARDACLPDMLLDGSGALLVSSNVQPVLWRVSPSRFEVERFDIELDRDQDMDVGFSSLAWAADGKTLLAASAATGTLWRIDVVSAKAVQVGPSTPVHGACAPTRGDERRALTDGRINGHRSWRVTRYGCCAGVPPASMACLRKLSDHAPERKELRAPSSRV